MKTFLFCLFILVTVYGCAQERYSTNQNLSQEFKGKYQLAVKLDEKKGSVSFTTNAKIEIAYLYIYNKDQFAKREGTLLEQYFKPGKGMYTFLFPADSLKEQQAYWLKLTSSEGWDAEHLFLKRTLLENSVAVQHKEPEEIAGGGGLTAVLETNINCTAGIEKVTKELKKLDGVFSVKIDSKTGRLTLNYSPDGTVLSEIIAVIQAQGMDVNGKKTTEPGKNPCKN